MSSNPQSHSYRRRKETQRRIVRLFLLSDKYLRSARALSWESKSKAGTERYYKLIQLSIKCLKVVLREYDSDLEIQQKILALYKLGLVYFEETENYDEAEAFTSNAINICTRTSIMPYLLPCQILLVKILAKLNPTYAKATLNRFLFANREVPHKFCDFYILTHILFDDLNSVKRLSQETNGFHKLDASPKPLGVYYHLLACYNMLTRGHVEAFKDCYQSIETWMLSSYRFPVQLELMYHMLGLYSFLMEDNMSSFKECAKRIDRIIVKEQELKWKRWSVNGAISLNSPASGPLRIEIRWLNRFEFTSVYRLLLAASLMNQGLFHVAFKSLRTGLITTRNISGCLKGACGFHGSIKDLTGKFQTNAMLVFNFLYYGEIINVFHLGIESPHIRNITSGASSSSSRSFQLHDDFINSRGLTGAISKTYERKIDYFNMLLNACDNNVDEAIKLCVSMANETKLLDDISVFSTLQLLGIWRWQRELRGPTHENYYVTQHVVTDVFYNFMHLMNSKSISLSDSFPVNGYQCLSKQNHGFVTLILLMQICLDLESGDKLQDLIESLNRRDWSLISSPFTKVLLNLVSASYSSSLENSKRRIDNCIRLGEKMKSSHDDMLMKVIMYKAQLNFSSKNGTAAEVEAAKLSLMNLRKTIGSLPHLHDLSHELLRDVSLA